VYCSHTPSYDDLDATLRQYEEVIRWGRFDELHRFENPDDQKNTVSEADDSLQGLRVTSYKATRISYSPEKNSVFQQVEIKYYSDDNAIEKVIIDRQQWLYNADSKQWLLYSGSPKFKK
jgi:hypothetical protein